MSKTNFDDLDLATPGIEADEINTESATVGQVLTADGTGGAAFQAAALTAYDYGFRSAGATTSGSGAVAIGTYATAAYTSVAIGYGADGSGEHGVAIGHGAYATAENGVALGASANAGANNAVAIGTLVQNSTADSVRIGWGNSAGDYMHLGDFTPTAATPTATHTIPVTLNGATYKIMLSSI